MSGPRKSLAVAVLNQWLSYDRVTGIFAWKMGRRIGKVAGSLNSDGYVRIKVEGIEYQAHRIAWAMVTGSWPSDEIDHRNRNRTDNRFDNLRAATSAQNKANWRAFRNNRLGLKGVRFVARIARYTATLGRTHLGYFYSAEAAHAAYLTAARERYGEFAE